MYRLSPAPTIADHSSFSWTNVTVSKYRLGYSGHVARFEACGLPHGLANIACYVVKSITLSVAI